jgi:hypothetical protein
MKNRSLFIPAAALCIMTGVYVHAEVYLPGTQPQENDIRVGKVKLCKTCHSKTGDESAEPYRNWQGGMMSQASRDPVYLAALTIANQDLPGVGEFCIRCHSPAGWLEGRSKSPDGSDLTDHDRNGVSCAICHRLEDPLSDAGKALVETPPPGYGSGMMVMKENDVVTGPYSDSPAVKSHRTEQSDFLASSQLCGTCHDVSNPLAATDIKTDPPSSYGIIERTYSEWLLSDYAKEPGARSCQSCHFPEVEGGGKAARHKDAPHRDYLVQHGPVGGSIWVQNAIIDIYGADEVDADALRQGIEKTRDFLKTAAKLEISFPETAKVNIRVTNLTGHKLPTGYIEGRRMWINMKFMDAEGVLLKEIGEYQLVEAEVGSQTVKARILADADKTRVYECLPGLSEKQAAEYGKAPGKSFHFVLNDIITKDSRIPPKGFNNAAFAERGCAPVGVVYTDGQYWDDVRFELPENCASVEAALIYEPVSFDYIKFLVEENKTDDHGNVLLRAWQKVGDTTAAVIATAKASP